MKHTLNRLTVLLLALILLFACQSPTLWGLPVSTPTPTNTATATVTATLAATITPVFTPTVTPFPRPSVDRVLLVSYDGLRPDVIDLAPMPNLQELMKTGAYSLTAQTIFPSATLPAHSSMVGGVCPDKHGVYWNDYHPDLGYAKGTNIFDLAHTAGIKTAMYVGKEKMRQLAEPETTDVYEYINDRDLVIADKLVENFPVDFGFMFVHFATVDAMGHEYGWLSEEQLSVAYRGDEALGKILATLDAYGLREGSLIIVTADHGGHDTTHGYSLPEDMTIPWIISGPGVQPLHLSTPIVTMDTAATIAYALGLDIPSEWDGTPVLEAFGMPSITHAVICN